MLHHFTFRRLCTMFLLLLLLVSPAMATGTTGDLSAPAATSGNAQEPELKAPEAVTGIKISPTSSTSLTLSWTASTGADSYEVWQSTKKDTSYKLMGTTAKTTYTAKKLKVNTIYYYKLVACASETKLRSKESSPKSMKTGMAATTKLTASAKKKVVTLSWKKISGAASYQIYRKTGSGKYKLIATVKSTSWKDKTVKNNQKYTYRIRAKGTYQGTTRYGDYCKGVAVKVLPLSGFTICVDAGHGNTKSLGTVRLAPGSKKKVTGGTRGTRGVATGVSEASLNLKVAKQLKTALEKKGATVVMVRTSSVCNLNNVQRCKVATKAKADLTIRLHADGSTNRSVHGVSMQLPGRTYCSKSMVSKSTSAGKAVYKAVLKSTGAKGMGLQTRNDLVGFNWSTTPSILLEMGFMSNKAEDRKLQTSAYQKKIVSGIVNGTVTYFT